VQSLVLTHHRQYSSRKTFLNYVVYILKMIVLAIFKRIGYLHMQYLPYLKMMRLTSMNNDVQHLNLFHHLQLVVRLHTIYLLDFLESFNRRGNLVRQIKRLKSWRTNYYVLRCLGNCFALLPRTKLFTYL